MLNSYELVDMIYKDTLIHISLVFKSLLYISNYVQSSNS